MSKRLSRYLIDKVDARLGDVEKEKRFDIIMIVVGVLLMLSGIFLASSHVSIILGVILSILGFAIAYVMIQEYHDDCKKARLKEPPISSKLPPKT